MKTRRSITYTAFNIRLHPHTSMKYVELMERIFALKRQVKLRGDTYAILTQVTKLHGDAESGLFGEIAKYTKIEESNGWFNLQELRAAEDYETRKIQIPNELKPNFKNFNFVFYPKNHYLIIECHDKFGSISPRLIERYFSSIFSSKEIVNEFNEVEITQIPRADQLDAIFSLKTLSHLELVIRRPNTDGLDDIEADVLKRLNNQNVVEEKISLKAQSGCSIDADEKTKSLAHVAQLNGEVKGSGTDHDGKRVERSTKTHPFTEVGRYISGEISTQDFLSVMASKIISKIKPMKRPKDENAE